MLLVTSNNVYIMKEKVLGLGQWGKAKVSNLIIFKKSIVMFAKKKKSKKSIGRLFSWILFSFFSQSRHAG